MRTGVSPPLNHQIMRFKSMSERPTHHNFLQGVDWRRAAFCREGKKGGSVAARHVKEVIAGNGERRRSNFAPSLRWPSSTCLQTNLGTQKNNLKSFFVGPDGGDEGNRTPDLRFANASLFQLSYAPTPRRTIKTSSWVKSNNINQLIWNVVPYRRRSLGNVKHFSHFSRYARR